ncbi:MAG: RCC1 domain-containing protein [Actinomycetota bacterium]|nr:RCC1 domain-containing protein [Actinomycetota bacterium]
MAAKESGHVGTWGLNTSGQCDVPDPNEDFVAIDAGLDHSLGLKSDGSIVAWGNNAYGKCDVPEPNADFTTSWPTAR